MKSNYEKIFGNYWNIVDQKITDLIKKHTAINDMVFEVGFASGHFLAAFADAGLNVSGIEIRENIFNKTKKEFETIYPNIKLIHGNVLDISHHYDLVYSTGLIQCLSEKQRSNIIKHISRISNKVIFTVPKIDKPRNIGSDMPIAVSGCEEYTTSNIAYELSTIYKYVECGIWRKNIIKQVDDFIWFYCDNPRTF